MGGSAGQVCAAGSTRRIAHSTPRPLLGWTLVKVEESKGNWDYFDAAFSPQSDDALEGASLLSAEASGACAFYGSWRSVHAASPLTHGHADSTLPATKGRDASASSAASAERRQGPPAPLVSQRPPVLPPTSGGLGQVGAGVRGRLLEAGRSVASSSATATGRGADPPSTGSEPTDPSLPSLSSTGGGLNRAG